MTSGPLATPCLGDRVREKFPFFEEHPDTIYFNTSAMPLRPRAVLEAIRDGFFDPARSPGLREAAERRIADFLRVPTADVHPVMGCHMAFERIHELIFDPARPLILTSPFAHKAILTPLDRWQSRGQIERRRVAVDASGRTDVGALRAALTPSVRGLVVNHVASVTGVVEPLEDIAKAIADFNAAESAEVLLIVDGAQSVPRLPVRAGIADFYLVASQKCGGLPGGVVIAGERARRAMARTEDPVAAMRFTHEHLRAGTPHTEAIHTLAVALDELARVDWNGQVGMDAVAEANAALRDRLLDGLERLPVIELLNGTRRSNAGIVTFQHRDLDAATIGAALSRAGILVRVGVKDAYDHWFCVPDLPTVYPAVSERDGAIRISLSYYNTPAEIDRLLEVLEEVTG